MTIKLQMSRLATTIALGLGLLAGFSLLECFLFNRLAGLSRPAFPTSNMEPGLALIPTNSSVTF